ncbi:MAG: MotA/TolQ/ExbB proton channel family protein [Gammaproteobacteria bacterium]|nr:MotA/TolQ/ExbB proton channel family protein [Gammaproteobacteria bacterium]
MELGGPVLSIIAVVILLMWVQIVERAVFFGTSRKMRIAEAQAAWEARRERRSWQAHRIREALISRFALSAHAGIPMIKTLVALCPLLGLLGTVTGMVAVFDAMADAGTGNARSMAAGVSQATIPTMAGMVGALSGVFAGILLSRKANRYVDGLQDSLTMDH